MKFVPHLTLALEMLSAKTAMMAENPKNYQNGGEYNAAKPAIASKFSKFQVTANPTVAPAAGLNSNFATTGCSLATGNYLNINRQAPSQIANQNQKKRTFDDF